MSKNIEVEVGFKIKQTQKQAEELLVGAGYELIFATQTHDIYFTNNEILPNMTEQEIKHSLIRLRHTNGTCGFDNYNLFDKTAKNRFKCSFMEAVKTVQTLQQNGYTMILDTYKTDYIYRNGTACHQLQNIKDIGLLDYYFDESLFNLTAKEQFDTLSSNMAKLGFKTEYPEGIDKLRTLLYGELCFSKNQNGDYAE